MLPIHLAAIDSAAPLDERARTEILTPDALDFLVHDSGARTGDWQVAPARPHGADRLGGAR
ncbi:MAG: hypothetical protein QOI16_3090 [Pseudonocardiales bacterium]|jgi:hypothetical protein|nr:hypothetical protein [Pseudonocardiales bacterium]